MAKGKNQKFKLYRLAQIMLEKTDEDHFLTMAEIKEELARYEITAERKSLYNDLRDLEVLGIEVAGEPCGGGYRYHVVERPFEIPELKLLVDVIQSSKFITARKSNQLIAKLEKLASKYEASALQRQVFVAGRIKTMNETIYYNVDAENYYLVGYDSDAEQIKHYRVDKMLKITLSEEAREGKEFFQKLDMAAYAKKSFGMYGGKEEAVKLLVKNDLAGVIIDRFGKDVMMVPADEARFTVKVDVQVSGQFLGWIFALGDGVEILGPPSVRARMNQEILRLADRY